MTGQDEKTGSDSERRIEANLKKVYEDAMNEPMSDQLANLVAQLRQRAASTAGGNADG